MVRAYHESSGKTIYVIREVIDSETESRSPTTSP